MVVVYDPESVPGASFSYGMRGQDILMGPSMFYFQSSAMGDRITHWGKDSRSLRTRWSAG